MVPASQEAPVRGRAESEVRRLPENTPQIQADTTTASYYSARCISELWPGPRSGTQPKSASLAPIRETGREIARPETCRSEQGNREPEACRSGREIARPDVKTTRETKNPVARLLFPRTA